jgi:hypothetical protein
VGCKIPPCPPLLLDVPDWSDQRLELKLCAESDIYVQCVHVVPIIVCYSCSESLSILQDCNLFRYHYKLNYSPYLFGRPVYRRVSGHFGERIEFLQSSFDLYSILALLFKSITDGACALEPETYIANNTSGFGA